MAEDRGATLTGRAPAIAAWMRQGGRVRRCALALTTDGSAWEHWTIDERGIRPGPPEAFDVRLALQWEDWLRLVGGRCTPLELLAGGRLTVSGDLEAALALLAAVREDPA